MTLINRYRRKRPKVDASIFGSVLTRRSDVSGKKEENSVSTFGRFRLWTSFESPPVSVKVCKKSHWTEFLFTEISVHRPMNGKEISIITNKIYIFLRGLPS